MITIDGSFGEGGGQIIRTSCALSLISGKPFRVFNVRARRSKPGLQRQHLTAVHAAAEIGGAKVDGASIGSNAFSFVPGEVKVGEYVFNIGTAGSTTLVLQTVLPPLMLAAEPSLITLEGGTHNVHAPPFEFFAKTFLPLVNRLGAEIKLELVRYGFYPRGGGSLLVRIEPCAQRRRLDLSERGPIRRRLGCATVVNLPQSIALRELAVLKEKLAFDDEQLTAETSTNAFSPGNVVTIELESDQVTEVFSGIGERGVRAEVVAERAAVEALRYLEDDAPVGEHLADQLLIPLAISGGGSYLTGHPSLHTTTNIEIIRKFLDVEITARPVDERRWIIEVRP